MNLNPELKNYIENEILPRYDHFDQAHQRDHALMVIEQSMALADKLDVNRDMVYAIAAFHDTGLCEGREHHHEVSARIIREDPKLPRWFSPEQIEVMAEAAEDHRASASHEPRSIYGRIVAEADRFIDPVTIVNRTIQYGLDHYPELDRKHQYQRMIAHLHEKYGRQGYLKLWFADSPNAQRLEKLRQMIDDETCLEKMFWEYFNKEGE
ncbi:MAG: HD domain-containing protein [Bacteroidales bacterium]|nr:HD domain-containing protein [Bacteroidales bacterium]